MTIKERYALYYQLARLIWDCGKHRDFSAMMEIYSQIPISDHRIYKLARRSVEDVRGSYD